MTQVKVVLGGGGDYLAEILGTASVLTEVDNRRNAIIQF
jgi:hypothetical protein